MGTKMYSSRICGWPEEDRPREKLARYGESHLSNSELLAILLRTGIKGESAVGLARRILEKFKTFRQMSHTHAAEWQEFKGIGPAKMAQIRAALEIGRRFREEESRHHGVKIKSSVDVYDVLAPQMRDLKVEVFKTIFLDSQNRMMDVADESIGTVNYATPIIRELFQKALQKFAVSLICVHNHPSGNPQPSQEDRAFTRKLADAGRVMGIKVQDHIIIGDGAYYSFADQGLITGHE